MPSLSQIIRAAGAKAAKKRESFSDIVRRAGAAQRKTNRTRPAQTKASLAGKFNARIEQLIKEGFEADELPARIENPDSYKSSELKKLVSAASKKKSSGVYQQGERLVSEFRRSYTETMVDIINERREKIRKSVESIVPTVGGEPADVERGKMGDLRTKQLRNLKKDRTFRSKKDEDYYIRSLPKMLDAERAEVYRDNIIVALNKNFGQKANNIIAMILKMNPSDVVKAYYVEELFDITTMYEQDENDTGYIDILKEALYRVGAERARSTEKTRQYTKEAVEKSEQREANDIKARILQGV